MSSLNDQLNELFAPKSLPDIDALFGDVDGTNAVPPPEDRIDDHTMDTEPPLYEEKHLETDDDIYDSDRSDIEEEWSDGVEEVQPSEDEEQGIEEDEARPEHKTTGESDNIEKTRSVKFQLEISEKLFDLHAQVQKIMTAINRLPACLVEPERKTVESELAQHVLGLRSIRPKLNSSLEEEEYTKNPASVTSEDAGRLFVEDVNRFGEQRDRMLQAWYERTRAPSFAMLEVPILQAISQALGDPSKLVRRTQLKRFKGDIIGKTEERTVGGQDVYDEEIFDDNDFFYSLLERSFWKSSRAIVMSACPQRKVPSYNYTKKPHFPSKGRLLRFNVHPKLVNFFCPDPSIEEKCPLDREALLDAIRGDQKLE